MGKSKGKKKWYPIQDADGRKMNRAEIRASIDEKRELINAIKAQIRQLEKDDLMLCDETQRYEEKYEEVIVSKRPKVTKKVLVGRIYWDESFKDMDTDKSITIQRSMVVKIDNEWQ